MVDSINKIKIDLIDEDGLTETYYTNIEVMLPKLRPKYVPPSDDDKEKVKTYAQAKIKAIKNIGVVEIKFNKIMQNLTDAL